MSRMEGHREPVQREQKANAPAHRGSEMQEQFKQFLEKSKGQEAKGRPLMKEQQSVKASLPKRLQTNQQAAHRVREQIKQLRPDLAHAFNDDFFKRHHYHPVFFTPGYNWWGAPSWVDVNDWLGWGWDYPYYYDDEGFPIPIENAPEAEQGEEVAEDDWLPLGVYAAARTVNQAAFSPMLVQLALDKEGDLAGTYYNTSTDLTHELVGMVDRTTQQAVWKLADNPDSPTMTTGLYNLAQDVATVQVHFPDGTEQTWVLVRLNQ